jgi:protein phosphatase
MILEVAAVTHTGRVRAHNEDALAFDPERGYAVLADGLGGCNAGEVASRMAVDIVSSALTRAIDAEAVPERDACGVVAEAIASANAAIFERAAADEQCAGMGTTIVVGLWRKCELVAAHVGDSRLYRRRGEALERLTRDHSLAQESIDRGLVSALAGHSAAGRAIVTRAVGIEPGVEPEAGTFDVARADVYLLCSDGLTDMLSDSRIGALLTAHLPALKETADALVRAANDEGGRDNISVILARLGAPEAVA